jgi:DNA polymerase-1
VRNHIGVRPEQIPDFLALIGDAVDHIPGVPGVGPKTAQRWLAQYGTISELLRHVDELEPSRLRDRVRVAQDVLQRNLALVRLRTCVEGLPPWRELELRNPVEPERRKFLEKLGLKSLILAPASPMLL